METDALYINKSLTQTVPVSEIKMEVFPNQISFIKKLWVISIYHLLNPFSQGEINILQALTAFFLLFLFFSPSFILLGVFLLDMLLCTFHQLGNILLNACCYSIDSFRALAFLTNQNSPVENLHILSIKIDITVKPS